MAIQAHAFGQEEGHGEHDFSFDVPERLRTSFWARLRASAESAILLGVKIAIVLAFVLAVWIGFGEFTQTRIGAKQGAAAFQYIQQIEQARQKSTPKAAEKP